MAKKQPSGKAATQTGDPIASYAREQSPGHAAICDALRAEIDAALPGATSKIWHGSPVWFIGENPVVGYSTAPKQVKLLFWSGQSFGETGLKTVGKFAAAQTTYQDASQIDAPALRRWLEKSRTNIWDYQEHFVKQMALRKKQAVK